MIPSTIQESTTSTAEKTLFYALQKGWSWEFLS
jgi:hypothetical protein